MKNIVIFAKISVIVFFIFEFPMLISNVSAEDDVDPGTITFREPLQMQNESIDPFTGELSIKNVDLELPGDGGMSVSIIRTYKSSRLTTNNDYIGDEIYPEILGKGWDIHFGWVQYLGDNKYKIELQDGTTGIAYPTSAPYSGVMTKDFWKIINLYGGAIKISLPDGTEIFFELYDPSLARYYATRIQKNGNGINIDYTTAGSGNGFGIHRIHYFNNGIEKNITFTYGGTGNRLQSISWGEMGDQKSITYSYENGGESLKSVSMPPDDEGYDKWQYFYLSGKYGNGPATWHLHNVITPTGGQLEYPESRRKRTLFGFHSQILQEQLVSGY